MTEYQTHTPLVQSLEAEVSRLRAVNAELKGIIEAGIKPNNPLVQAARQALEVLSEPAEWESEGDPRHPASAAITALREALEAAHQPPAAEQEPVMWALWRESTGWMPASAEKTREDCLAKSVEAAKAEGVSEQWIFSQGWLPKPLYTTPKPARQPLTEGELDLILQKSPIKANYADLTALVRAVEKAHGIGGEA